MNHPIRYAVLVLALLAPRANLQGKTLTLRAGTLIQCTLYEPRFSSKTAQIGDPVTCDLRPLRQFGLSVFPRGSYLAGRFADYQDPGRFIGKGWLKLEFDRLIVSPTAEVAIAAKVVSVRGYRMDPEGRILGRGHVKRDAFFWSLPILWPIKLLTLPRRGPYPTLKGEVPLTLRLMDDVDVPICVPRGEPLSQRDSDPFPESAAYPDRARKAGPRRIPVLESVKDLAWPVLGSRPQRTDAPRQVEILLGLEN